MLKTCLYDNGVIDVKAMLRNKKNDRSKHDDLRAMGNLCRYHDIKHDTNLHEEFISWLKKNVKQFDKKVLDKIIEDSVLPDKPNGE